MADSLSHSCPTCKGNVILGIHYLSDPYTGEVLSAQEEICPDCIDGVYPKAAVERASAVFSELTDINAPSAAQTATPRIIGAYYNEGEEE